MAGTLQKSVLILLIFSSFATLALGADWGLVSTQGNVTMSGYNITLMPSLNFSTMRSDGTTLNITFNSTTVLFNSTADLNLSSIVYTTDFLNWTASQNTGTMTVTAKMANNSNPYYLFVGNTKTQSASANSSGWVSFSYSGAASFSVEPDYKAPTFINESIASASVQQGFSNQIIAYFSDDNAVSSALVRVEAPDNSQSNFSMTCGAAAAVVMCQKIYTSTVLIGTYYIRFYYPQDNSSNVGNISSTKSFLVTEIAAGGGTGGGGGGGGGSGGSVFTVTTPVTEIVNKTVEVLKNISQPLAPAVLEFRNITSGSVFPTTQLIQDCLTKSLIFDNSCSSGSGSFIIIEPSNAWIFLGGFLFPLVFVVSIMIGRGKKRAWVTDFITYGLITTILMAVLAAGGINVYILNYIFNNPKYALSFTTAGMYSIIIAAIGDHYGYRKRKNNEWVIL